MDESPMLYQLTPTGNARRLNPVPVANENAGLQRLVAQNLFLLPGQQIDPEDPRRWLLIREEMPVPDPGTGTARWSVDLLLTDQSGTPTFVECKRYADTRARREVVGQMLEYAANGHYYWDRALLRAYVEETAGKVGRSVESLVADLDPPDAGTIDDLLDAFVERLREGRVRLIFFMEEAPQELKSIVDFLNRQTELSEILIVEARQFESEGARLVAPSLFGYTEEARRAKRPVTVAVAGGRRRWNEERFFEEARNVLPLAHVQVLEKVFRIGQERGFGINWGTGARRGSFSLVAKGYCSRSFLSILTDAQIWVNLQWLDDTEEARALRTIVADEMRRAGLPAKDTENWTYGAAEWLPHSDGLIEALGRIPVVPEAAAVSGGNGA